MAGESNVKPSGKDLGTRCPICRAPASDEARPFCSKRCADVDLSRWLKGVYVIPGGADGDDEEDSGRSEIAGNSQGEGE